MRHLYLLIAIYLISSPINAQKLPEISSSEEKQNSIKAVPKLMPVCIDIGMTTKERKSCYQVRIAEATLRNRGQAPFDINSLQSLLRPTARANDLAIEFGVKPGLERLNRNYEESLNKCLRDLDRDCSKIKSNYDSKLAELYNDELELAGLREAYEVASQRNATNPDTQSLLDKKEGCTTEELSQAVRNAERRARAEGIIETIREQATLILAGASRVDGESPDIKSSHAREFKEMRDVVDKKIDNLLQDIRDEKVTSEVAVQQANKWTSQLMNCGKDSGACHND